MKIIHPNQIDQDWVEADHIELVERLQLRELALVSQTQVELIAKAHA